MDDAGTPAAVFADAAAGADGVANPTAGGLFAFSVGYNGTTWDRWRSNIEGTLLASAARTATATSADFTNHNGLRIALLLNVTAKAGATTIQLALDVKDPVSGSYQAIAAPTAFAAAAGIMYVLLVGPGLIAADSPGTASAFRAAHLARTMRIRAIPSDTDSVTYSIGYSLNV